MREDYPMAVLRAKVIDMQLILTPYRVTDPGQPTWLATQLVAKRDGNDLLSTTLSLTRDDLAELRSRIELIINDTLDEFVMTNSDEDLVVNISKAAAEGDVTVGFWFGEPYDLMTGYRFVVQQQSLREFTDALREEESKVKAPGQLP
jgi:hypothetical protein